MRDISEIMKATGDLKIEQLRQAYPRFIYESFSLERTKDELRVRFFFSLGPDIAFQPEIVFPSMRRASIDSLNRCTLEYLVFHLGLIELLSYWKSTCSPEIVIKAGYLSQEQVKWFEDLLVNGMGEFFYVNKIDFRHPDFVRIVVDNHTNNIVERFDGASSDRTLVLTSGGKDSALTLQLLREAGTEFGCLMLNPVQAAIDLAATAGCTEPFIVRRTIDPKLLEMNKAGFLNGHTPFSAYLSFLGVICATLYGYGPVIVSNERSSNEGNIEFLGTTVNHQYSKTYRFEERFQKYSKQYLASGVNYFSLLRPLYEIQIVRLFVNYPQYFTRFKSCNRKQQEGIWCGSCPKCLSIYVLFYPFLEPSELITIFGRDLFEDDRAIPLLNQLAGIEGHKPFECVGTIEETIAALYLGIRRTEISQRGLPPALSYAKENILSRYPQAIELAEDVLSAWSDQHNVPPKYERIIKSCLKSSLEKDGIRVESPL